MGHSNNSNSRLIELKNKKTVHPISTDSTEAVTQQPTPPKLPCGT